MKGEKNIPGMPEIVRGIIPSHIALMPVNTLSPSMIQSTETKITGQRITGHRMFENFLMAI